jgi:glycosyltransferase involved in cell wall biosynthesis
MSGGTASKVLARSAPARPEGASTTGVLFVTTATYSPLGADSWIHTEIIGALDRQRHRLHVACAATDPAGAPTPTYTIIREIPDVTIVPVNFGVRTGGKLRSAAQTAPIIAGVARLARYVRRNRISVIHTTDRPSDAVAAVVLGRLTGAKVVIHVHVVYNPWMSRGLQWALRQADALVGVSRFVAERLVEAGHRPERVYAVQNGIDASRWVPGRDRQACREELGIDADAPMILTVCRLFPEKGPGDLIEAAALLRHDFPALMLVIAGQDLPGEHYSDELRAEVSRLGLDDAVLFTGHFADVSRLMAAADIFAMPSFEEPFGLVYLEAMAMGLPVVALANGGAQEIVEHDRTGLLSAPGDAAGLRANLAALLADRLRGNQLGAAGRQVVEHKFSTLRMASGTADVYARVSARDHQPQQDRGEAMNGGLAGSAKAYKPMYVDAKDTEECKKRLDEDGYALFNNVVSQQSLAELGEALNAEFEAARRSGALFQGGGTVAGHLNCFPGAMSRFVYDDLIDAGVVKVVAEVRPDIVDEVRATLNFNLPGSIAQHYHSDGLYVEEFLICNVAVVDTTLANGAIDLLPGTHRQFVKYWRHALHRHARLSKRIPMKRGDALLRKSTVWHRGMPNRSSEPRPMMAITFGELAAPEANPFGLNDGKPFFFPNWYNTGRLGRLRERTFVAAPITYSAYRFARSLYGSKGYSSW